MFRAALQQARYEYQPRRPPLLMAPVDAITVEHGEPTEASSDQAELRAAFPHTYGKPIATLAKGNNDRARDRINAGVILSGGPAPGGHNVIAGLLDGIKAGNSSSRLWGFLGGPDGILRDQAVELTPALVDEYRNSGGFDMIGSGRTKIETGEQLEAARRVLTERSIDALAVIGGDDSNTNAAVLAEYFADKGAGIQVIGVPKTIDGDLKNAHIETSFGFDTATKTYAELIGNIQRDADSAKKYWHFIKLMGRTSSHIALECALQTRPNVALIAEEVGAENWTLRDVVDRIVSVVRRRADNGENFGTVLVPDGLLYYIPEFKTLISELNDLLAEHAEYFATLNSYEDQSQWVNHALTRDSSYVFSSLPNAIQRQLLMDRDPHGNVQFTRIETEKLLLEMVEAQLAQLASRGAFTGAFGTQHHSFGYEGRCAYPSNFDADYCYALGYTAFLLLASGLTGYISALRDVARSPDEWTAVGIPITMLMNMERRKGKMLPVIRKAIVDLEGAPFRTFAAHRDEWTVKTCYRYPGAIQYFGPEAVCNQPTMTLRLEHGIDG